MDIHMMEEILNAMNNYQFEKMDFVFIVLLFSSLVIAVLVLAYETIVLNKKYEAKCEVAQDLQDSLNNFIGVEEIILEHCPLPVSGRNNRDRLNNTFIHLKKEVEKWKKELSEKHNQFVDMKALRDELEEDYSDIHGKLTEARDTIDVLRKKCMIVADKSLEEIITGFDILDTLFPNWSIWVGKDIKATYEEGKIRDYFTVIRKMDKLEEEHDELQEDYHEAKERIAEYEKEDKMDYEQMLATNKQTIQALEKQVRRLTSSRDEMKNRSMSVMDSYNNLVTKHEKSKKMYQLKLNKLRMAIRGEGFTYEVEGRKIKIYELED